MDLMVVDDDSDCEFTIAEIAEMGNLYKQTGKESVNQQWCEELATKFSCSARRCEKESIKWEQVYDWFKDIKRESENRMLALEQKEVEDAAPNSLLTDNTEVKEGGYEICLHDMDSKKANKSNRGRKAKSLTPFGMMADNCPPMPRAAMVAELPDLIFEAKSSRDLAWYDVAVFLNYRVTYFGALEVRVRFNGFDKDHDEWVNVQKGVRERSIPLLHSECHRVNIGDLVLCYRDAEALSVYCDAYVVDIQRNTHEDDTCSCIFVVQYEYDNFEEKVPAGRICYRPAKKAPQDANVPVSEFIGRLG